MDKYQIILRSGIMFTIMAVKVIHSQETSVFYEKESDYKPICRISSDDCYVKLGSEQFEYKTAKMP